MDVYTQKSSGGYMSINQVKSFRNTMDKSYEWLSDIQLEMPWIEHEHAFAALKATLKSVRDRLTPEEAVHFGSQLPALLRGYYFEGWKLSKVPSCDKDIEDIMKRFEKYFGHANVENPYLLFKTCLKIITNRVSQGEIEDVESVMPKRLKSFWKNL